MKIFIYIFYVLFISKGFSQSLTKNHLYAQDIEILNKCRENQISNLLTSNDNKKIQDVILLIGILHHNYIPDINLLIKSLHKNSWIYNVYGKEIEQKIINSLSDKELSLWFQSYQPISDQAQVFYYHQLYQNANNQTDKNIYFAAFSKYWKKTLFTNEIEKIFLETYVISQNDINSKIEYTLWQGKYKYTEFLLKYLKVKSLYNLNKQRLSASQGLSILTSNNDEFQMLILTKHLLATNIDKALLVLASLKPVHHIDIWWKIAHVAIREAISKRKYEIAFSIASIYSKKNNTEAAWLAGFIASNFLNKFDIALKNFELVYNTSQSLNFKSQSAYWLSKTYDKAGKKTKSKQWLIKTSKYYGSFYSYIANNELGYVLTKKELFKPNNTGQSLTEEHMQMLKLASLLYSCSYNSTKNIIIYLAHLGFNNIAANTIAQFLIKHCDISLAVKFARIYADCGYGMLQLGYPIEYKNILINNPHDLALYLAIIRQESSFDIKASSPVGAFGLMQIMPKTAAMLAKNLNLSCDAYRINPHFNIIKGAFYIDNLIQKFDNNYIYAIAGYNGGSTNVARWNKNANNDYNKKNQILNSLIWIELISFKETRGYVKKVLENVWAYEILLNQKYKVIHYIAQNQIN